MALRPEQGLALGRSFHGPTQIDASFAIAISFLRTDLTKMIIRGQSVTTIFFFAGLASLLLGGEALVRGAVSIASRLHVPPLVIGLTIVGFGTSSPELMVAVQAALAGAPDIAVGNVLGSNIANTLLIMGIAAVVAPVALPYADLKRDLTVMLGATILLWLLIANAELARWEGSLLLTGLGIYFWLCFRSAGSQGESPKAAAQPIWLALLLIAGGLVGLMLGAHALVESASRIARMIGVSEAVIGLTIVAIGTSLPEMATSLMASYRGHGAIAVGNVIGSNILNLLGILGVTATITPIPIAARFMGVDMALVLASALALAAMSYRYGKLDRRMGIAGLAGYGAYMLWHGV
jgi:cation:H+ antiporter